MSAGTTTEAPEARRGNRLLWWAALAFAVLLAGWGAFLILARRHPVESVPVNHGGRSPAAP